jgi:glycerol-3-phosphate cytidylyltransferase-like family protein
MTLNILTPGHIKCLRYLSGKGELIVGLLSPKALKGYKKELMSWNDRKYILDNLNIDCKIVRQDSLDPTKCILQYKCNAIASGDGFENQELNSINKLKIKVINIKLRGEKKKMYSSSKIINKIKQNEHNH